MVSEGSFVTNVESHFLIRIDRKARGGRRFRRRCKGCYQKLKTVMHWKEAYSGSKQVHTMCNICDKFYCVNCFIADHKILNTTDEMVP